MLKKVIILFLCLSIPAYTGCSDSDKNSSDVSETQERPDSHETQTDVIFQLVPDVEDWEITPVVDTPADRTCADHWVVFVGGRIMDEQWNPMSDAKAQLCMVTSEGQSRCSRPVTADDHGLFSITVTEGSRCMTSAVMRIYQSHSDRITLYCNMELNPESGALIIPNSYVLHTTNPAIELTEGQPDVTRTAILAEGVQIDITPSALDGEYEELASRHFVPDSDQFCFLTDDDRTLEGLYAFSPEANVFDQDFPIKVPNTTNLPPNTEVSLFVLGGLYCSLLNGEDVHEGDWHEYGTGVVSSDGSFIESKSGFGLPCLTWFGYATP